MKLNDAFPSKFLAAADLQGNDVTVKITHISHDEIGGKQKYICFFAGKQKGLVLNKTNFNAIVKVTGFDDTDEWSGESICLFPTMVDFQGDSVAAIRIKAPPRETAKRKVAPRHDDDDIDGGEPTRQPVRPASAEMGRGNGTAPKQRGAEIVDTNDEIPF